MKITKQPRAGFTLLELLVVIAIIGILAAISAGAYFRLRASSMETRTNETLTKLHRAYEQQYKASIDLIRKEQIDPRLINLANNDMDMAKAVHMKLRLRREFPQNLADVDDTGVTTGNTGTDAILKSLYPPKAIYQGLVTAVMPVDRQNSILFMAVMSQSRGGASFNPEQIGANALGTDAGSGRKIFVDGYGNPIYFVRSLATSMNAFTTDMVNNELNQPPYVTAAAVTAKKADAIDPNGKLSQSWSSNPTMASFVSGMRQYMNEPLDGTNRGPFVFSPGVDKTPFTADDLYSFRLQNTGKAN